MLKIFDSRKFVVNSDLLLDFLHVSVILGLPHCLGNRCQHPRDAGSCRGQFVRWFFNTEIGNCEVFTYTGCAGNGNNFASREECLLTCSRNGTTNSEPTTTTVTPEAAESERSGESADAESEAEGEYKALAHKHGHRTGFFCILLNIQFILFC